MTTDTDMFNAARQFIQLEGRLLERRLFATLFEGAPAAAVVDVLRGYRNPDGGFGYGLEPDKRAPESQPLDVEVAWQSLDWAGIAPPDLIEPACDYLASVGAGVSCVTAVVTKHAHAPHWSDASDEPSLNPTAGLAGYLWKWDVDHPWRGAATEFCWSALDGGGPGGRGGAAIDAHTASGLLRFLEHVPDRERALAAIDALRRQLPTMEWLHYDAGAEGYGVRPLQLVPTPASPWADLFPIDVLDGHLDVLEKTQSADGGWDITWPTIGPAAVSEWRGRLTLQNLLALRAYGRLS
jgi:hypothetical protein